MLQGTWIEVHVKAKQRGYEPRNEEERAVSMVCPVGEQEAIAGMTVLR